MIRTNVRGGAHTDLGTPGVRHIQTRKRTQLARDYVKHSIASGQSQCQALHQVTCREPARQAPYSGKVTRIADHRLTETIGITTRQLLVHGL